MHNDDIINADQAHPGSDASLSATLRSLSSSSCLAATCRGVARRGIVDGDGKLGDSRPVTEDSSKHQLLPGRHCWVSSRDSFFAVRPRSTSPPAASPQYASATHRWLPIWRDAFALSWARELGSVWINLPGLPLQRVSTSWSGLRKTGGRPSSRSA